MDEDTLSRVTLRDLADALGIKVEAARGRAKRNIAKGRWKEEPRNHPAAPLVLIVPSADLSAASREGKHGDSSSPPSNIGPSRAGVTLDDVRVSYETALASMRLMLDERETRIVQMSERLLMSETALADLKARAELTDATLRRQIDDLVDVVEQLRNRNWLDRLLKR
jgi:hypothetical protein